MNNESPYNLISLQHELLMSIGNLTDHDEMLKQFSLKVIKTLNLKRIYVIQKENKLIEIEESIFSIPPSPIDFIKKFPPLLVFKNAESPTETNFIEKIECDKGYIYCFGVKDLGYMFFERRLKPLDEGLLAALVAPLNRFTQNYLNRQQFVLNLKQKEQIKKMSAVLELDKLKFESILGAINDSVIAINANKKIIFANKSAYKNMGLDNKSELNLKYYEYFRLLSLDDFQDITSKLEKLILANSQKDVDTSVIFKANNVSPIVCELNIKEIKDRRNPNISEDTYIVVTFHDITQAYEMEKKLAWQATHDHLTGSCNRAGFEKALEDIIESKTGNHVLFYMDLDRFKQVNDIGGHQAGDALLKQVTTLISCETREKDVLARVGGDEFSIIAKNCPIDVAKKMAERIREKIERLRFQWEEHVFTIGISIGLSEITAKDVDPKLVVFKADEACMESKRNGRNQVTVAGNFEEIVPSNKGSNNFITFINKSLSTENNSLSFLLYQQSIKAISEKDEDHIEILLRMKYGNKVILPDAFLPTAERYGKIAEIDLWVVKNTFKYIKQAQSITVNVNLSGITLSDDVAMKKLLDLISEHPQEAKNLCLEITETSAITNLSKCVYFMEKAKDLGVSFALDDFGTGVSSFGNLKNLPVDFLKIDGLFIRDICENKIDQIVVRSIIDAARAMNIKTVAEYVEDELIFDKVSEIGADFAQGYYFNRPEELRLH